jgi:predicted nucleotidyltransferase
VITNPSGVLTPAQLAVADEILSAEEQSRRHLAIYLSGSHAYGFPSPDSDLDLKAVHTEPTRNLLGLSPRPHSAARLEVVRGVEVDYTSNEIGTVLAGILGGNGNYVERFLGDLILYATPAAEELRPIVSRALSRRVHRHYRGFAMQQRVALEAAPTAKKILYVLRTALTGTNLLSRGELVTDVTRLLDEHGYGEARELIEIKRAGERTPLEPAMAEAWRTRLDALFERLDAARDRSSLPEEPANSAEVEAWLVDWRLRQL